MRYELWRAVVFTAAAALVTALYHKDVRAETSLIINGVSKHTGNKTYNETNTGLGLRYQVRPDASIQVGSYNNSFNRRSNYALVNYTPIQYGALSVGVFGGVASGYRQPLIAGAVVTYDFGNVTATVRAVPPVGNGTAGVVALEIGVKF